MHVFIGKGGSGSLPAGSTDQYAPDAAAFDYSDCCSVIVDPAAARFSRPTPDAGFGFNNTNPGARVRFATESAVVQILLQYTNLLTTVLYNGVGAILVNGTFFASFSRAFGPPGQASAYLDFGSSGLRTIEVVMPYSASVDFLGIRVLAGAVVMNAAARPATRLVAMGDSITQGFTTTAAAKTWAFLLGETKGWQVINHGYGGRQCVPADGTTLAALSPTVAAYLIGYNDFVAQLALATFKANYTAFINNFRAVNPTAKLHCITPIWSPNTNTLTLENYRDQIRDALTTLANPLNVLVEGAPLLTNNVSRLADTIHPNDLGAAEMATSLAAGITL